MPGNERGSPAEGNGSERTPLLSPAEAPDRAPATPAPAARKRFGIIPACILLLILIELGAYFINIPINQVLEEIICRRYAPSPPRLVGRDPPCKDNAVQAELSMLRGWQSTFDFVPGLLTAVPYGFLADRRGREFVLSLSLLGLTLANAFYIIVCAFPSVFPVRVTWLSSLFTFIGGGTAVFNAMVFTITADVVEEKHRSTAFSYLAAAVIGGELLSSSLVYFLMEKDLWLPIYLGLACLAVSTGLAFCLPETLPREPRAAPQETTPSSSWLQKMQKKVATMRKATLWLTLGHWKVALLLVTFLLTTLGRFAQEIMLQYVTKRYGWSWSQASLLLSVRALFTLALLIVLIPSANYLLVRVWALPAEQANLALAWTSALLLALGAFIMGLSAKAVGMTFGLGIFALGSGYNLLVRSLLASLVEQHHVAMLYTAVSIMETAGSLVAGPLLAMSFRIGMEWGGSWIGLPYLAAGCLFTVATVAVTSVVLASLKSRNDNSVTEDFH